MLSSKTKGIICIVLSSLSFALMNTFVRLSGDLPSVQKSFFRNLIALFIALFILWKEKQRTPIKKCNIKYHVCRSLFGTLGILCNFYAVDHLVLSDASMLNKTSPFFVILFSFFILKEKLNFVQGFALVAAFIGSLFIIKPSFTNITAFPAAIGLLGGISAGVAYTMVRLLGNRGEDKAMIIFFFSAFSCIVTLPYVIVCYVPMSLQQIWILLGAGLAATGGQFGITMAYCYASAREISVYDYSQILFSAILGFFLFGQVADGYSMLGYLIILSMAVYMFLRDNHKWGLKRPIH